VVEWIITYRSPCAVVYHSYLNKSRIVEKTSNKANFYVYKSTNNLEIRAQPDRKGLYMYVIVMLYKPKRHIFEIIIPVLYLYL